MFYYTKEASRIQAKVISRRVFRGFFTALPPRSSEKALTPRPDRGSILYQSEYRVERETVASPTTGQRETVTG